MHDYNMGFGFSDAIEEYAGSVNITKDPAKRIDVIIYQIFPTIASKAEECFDCSDRAIGRLKRNYESGLKLLAEIDINEAENYAQRLDDAFTMYMNSIENSKVNHLYMETKRKNRIENGDSMNYSKPVEIKWRNKNPYTFDGRSCGVLFRNYAKIVNEDDVRMLYEIGNECYEDVMMKTIAMTPEAEELAEKLGVLVEFYPPEHFEMLEDAG